MKKKRIVLIFVLIQICNLILVNADSIDNYAIYLNNIDGILTESDITANGFTIVESHRYLLEHQTSGEIEFIPSIHIKERRVVLFFADPDGHIIYKTDNLESNFWIPGQVKQANWDILSVSFEDLNHDGWLDIIFIASCKNDTGDYTTKPYKVGDVLFQNKDGFYRDWRISDKINRFDMNKFAETIAAFVRDGVSTEYLYTSKTLDELLDNDFEIIKHQSFKVNLEKFGMVDLISGFYTMSEQNFLMLYIVDLNGKILWDLQPMHDYVNFYRINGISFNDIDGDGLKDITLLADYVVYDTQKDIASITQDYNIYYQRAGYFFEDIDFKNTFKCSDDDDLSGIIKKARAFWGWR